MSDRDLGHAIGGAAMGALLVWGATTAHDCSTASMCATQCAPYQVVEHGAKACVCADPETKLKAKEAKW